jgi:peptidoglycan/xylan/chitin deacetylase (PgdA/CDA1 family)
MKPRIASLLLAALLTTAAIALFQPNAQAGAAPGTNVYGLPTTEKVCVLTFDDWYRSDYLQRTLGILKDRGVPATFFPSGSCEEAYPWRTQWILDAGCDLGNHTYSHRYLTQYSSSYVRWQVQKAEDCHALTGAPDYAPLFRAPGGSVSARVLGVLKLDGYVDILWNDSAGDTSGHATTQSVTNAVLSKLKPGAIILMHISKATTPAALPAIIDGIQARGYTIVDLRDSLFPEQAGYNRYQQNSPWIYYCWWGWANKATVNAYAGSMKQSTVATAYFKFSFTGSYLELIGALGPSYGKASLVLDGGQPIEINWNRWWSANRQTICQIDGLSEGTHTVVVTVTSGRINLDAVKVRGNLVKLVQ